MTSVEETSQKSVAYPKKEEGKGLTRSGQRSHTHAHNSAAL